MTWRARELPAVSTNSLFQYATTKLNPLSAAFLAVYAQ